MRMTAIRTQTERKRLDRPVRRTEKQGRRASTARSRGSIRPIRVVSATADTALGKKTLDRVASLGDLEVIRQATRGISA
jgi:hypothetical protein